VPPRTLPATQTRRSALRYGRGLRSTALTTEKMAVFAPTPSASVNTTTAVNPGRFHNILTP
jgi:hypothetical protein